jgi:hypothetical protein
MLLSYFFKNTAARISTDTQVYQKCPRDKILEPKYVWPSNDVTVEWVVAQIH